MKFKKRNYLQVNNSGFTLVGVLMVLVVLSVLGLSILMITSNSVKISAGERDDQSVFYIAEAGVVETVYEINKDVSDAFVEVKAIYDTLTIKGKKEYDFVGTFYSKVIGKVNLSPSAPTFEKNLGNEPTASIKLNQNGAGPIIYEIKSVGKIGNKTRTVTQELTVFLDPSMIEGPGMSGNVALYVNKTVNLGGSVKIHGDANMQSTNLGDIEISGGAGVTGKIVQGVENIIELPPFPAYPAYSTPGDQVYNGESVIKGGKLLINKEPLNGYTLNMDRNMNFGEIHLNSNRTLIINVGNSDKEVVVDHLNVENGHIKIIGTGKLTIFVVNKIAMGSASTINTMNEGLWSHEKPGEIRKLQVYQKGSNPINLEGGQKIYGSLHAEAADISIKGGGGFQGNIFTGGQNVYVGGGSNVNSQLFLAPNSKFVLGEGGHIKGTIIADSFVGTGGGSVTYDETNSDLESGGSIKDYGDGSNLITKTSLIEK